MLPLAIPAPTPAADRQTVWSDLFIVLSLLTMTVGNLAALLQNNLKRMLAYSSIAHAGYLLLGIIAANSAGKAAILFYLLVYAVSNLGALGIVALLGTPENEHDQLRDFAGLKESRPALNATPSTKRRRARRLDRRWCFAWRASGLRWPPPYFNRSLRFARFIRCRTGAAQSSAES